MFIGEEQGKWELWSAWEDTKCATCAHLLTLAMSPRSTASRYRFSSLVKGFGKLVMTRLLGFPIPGNGDGEGAPDAVCATKEIRTH